MSGQVLVTVFIPTYNQPDLLDRCLNSIRCQTLSKHQYEIILMDDRSTVAYDEVLQKNADLPIMRIVNQNNLGAVPNMIHCIKYPVTSSYKVVFHEDDLMYPDFLSDEINAFRQYPEAAWVGCNMSFFNKVPNYYSEEKTAPAFFKDDVSDVAAYLIEGKTLSLASIMYNAMYTDEIYWDLENYSMLGDRQMLLEIGKKYGCVYLNYCLVAAYDHSDVDFRWKMLTQEHIKNYYDYLYRNLDAEKRKRKSILAGFTASYIENYQLLPDAERKKKLNYYFQAFKNKQFSIKYYVLHNRAIRNAITKIKSYFT